MTVNPIIKLNLTILILLNYLPCDCIYIINKLNTIKNLHTFFLMLSKLFVQYYIIMVIL